MKYNEFEGKTVFITGAASGIGYAQAEGFLELGANVFGIDINETGLQELKRSYPKTFYFRIADVTIKEEVRESIHQSIAEFRRVHILVNTAGVLDDDCTTLDTSDELWDTVMDTNVKGVFNVTNFLLPHMLKWKKGVIINTASVARSVAGGGAAFTASKHAIIGYTERLNGDYSKKGIRAKVIAPGTIQNSMNNDAAKGYEKMINWVQEETPLGRMMQLKEMVNATLYLASEAAENIDGNLFTIDRAGR